MRTAVARAAAVALAFACAATGCNDNDVCASDEDCGDGQACAARMCIAWLTQPYPVALELEPDPGSGLARRDHGGVAFTREPLELELDRKVALRFTLVNTVAAASVEPSSVRLVFALPAELDGRPELTFEADAVSAGDGEPYVATIHVAERWLGRPTRLDVVPAPPLDRLLAPARLTFQLAAEMVVTLPGEAERQLIEGVVLGTTVPGAPAPVYEARLFVGGRVVSNVARTDETGKFTLRAQRTMIAEPSDGRIEIVPRDAPVPAMVMVLPFSGQSSLGGVRFPPVPMPSAFGVKVLLGQAEVPGATVRFVTSLMGVTSGDVRYRRTAQTDAMGTAVLPLLPGTGESTRDYTVTVVPPPGSQAGRLCVAQYAVGTAVAGQGVRFGAALMLPRKATVSGHVRRAGGGPAAHMHVRAVRVSPAPSGPCGDLGNGTNDGATSDDAGRYRLALDPGTYRLEIEPALGVPLPQHTVPELAVTADGATLDVTLPEAVLVEGRIVAPGAASPPPRRTEVRAVTRQGGSMKVIGTAEAGPDGVFRLVLPKN